MGNTIETKPTYTRIENKKEKLTDPVKFPPPPSFKETKPLVKDAKASVNTPVKPPPVKDSTKEAHKQITTRNFKRARIVGMNAPAEGEAVPRKDIWWVYAIILAVVGLAALLFHFL